MKLKFDLPLLKLPGNRYAILVFHSAVSLAAFWLAPVLPNPLSAVSFALGTCSLTIATASAINIFAKDQLFTTEPDSLSLKQRKWLRVLSLALPLPLLFYGLSVFFFKTTLDNNIFNFMSLEKSTLSFSPTWKLLNDRERAALDEKTSQIATNFMESLQPAIKRKWNPPLSQASSYILTTFKVQRDGKITDSRISISSGSANADQAALDALSQASGDIPLPNALEAPVDVEFHFDYNIKY